MSVFPHDVVESSTSAICPPKVSFRKRVRHSLEIDLRLEGPPAQDKPSSLKNLKKGLPGTTKNFRDLGQGFTSLILLEHRLGNVRRHTTATPSSLRFEAGHPCDLPPCLLGRRYAHWSRAGGQLPHLIGRKADRRQSGASGFFLLHHALEKTHRAAGHFGGDHKQTGAPGSIEFSAAVLENLLETNSLKLCE